LSSMDLPGSVGHPLLDGWRSRELLTRQATTVVRAPEDHDAGVAYCPPSTLIEQILASIYAEVLGVDRVGVDESFFDLGGESLTAMRAIAAINGALDLQLTVPDLFEAPSVRGLSQQVSGVTRLSE
jgi:acyl carrier protein